MSDGGVAYLRVPPELGLGEPWLRIDASRLADDLGLDATALGEVAGADPAGVVELLRGATDAQRVGEEEVRGVPTTRYEALLDPGRAAGAAPPERAAPARAAAARLGATPVPAEAWVDAAGVLRRLRYAADVPGGPGPVTATYELHDFGVAADVLLPPPDDTADLADLATTGR